MSESCANKNKKMTHDLEQLESVVLQQKIGQGEEEYKTQNKTLPEKAKYLDVGVHLLSRRFTEHYFL